jgi:hypothetical protein
VRGKFFLQIPMGKCHECLPLLGFPLENGSSNEFPLENGSSNEFPLENGSSNEFPLKKGG